MQHPLHHWVGLSLASRVGVADPVQHLHPVGPLVGGAEVSYQVWL